MKHFPDKYHIYLDTSAGIKCQFYYFFKKEIRDRGCGSKSAYFKFHQHYTMEG